jgi:hypothetical protein
MCIRHHPRAWLSALTDSMALLPILLPALPPLPDRVRLLYCSRSDSPWLTYARPSRCIFASATDEQIKALNAHNVDPTTYLLGAATSRSRGVLPSLTILWRLVGMFALSFVIYLAVIIVISAYVSPWFGVSRPPKGSSLGSLESGGTVGGLFSRTPAKDEQGYDLVEGGEVFELGEDDGSERSRDSFERELESDLSEGSGHKVSGGRAAERRT